MKRDKISFRIALAPFGLVAALAMGCDALDSSKKPSPTEPVLILAGGQCRVVGRSIECTDESQSIPANRLGIVEWTLRSGTSGNRVGSLTGGAGDEIAFSGLVFDVYHVTQRVNAHDGGSVQKIHNSLIVE